MTARSAGDNGRRCFIQIHTRKGDPVSRAIQGTPQMAVDKAAISLSRVTYPYSKCNLP